MNQIREYAENHPFRIVAAAFVAGISLATWVLLYAYVPMQLTSMERALDECKRAPTIPKESRHTADSTPIATVPDEFRHSPEVFGAKYKSFNGSFAEQREFLRRYNGLHVTWILKVNDISTSVF